MNYCWSIEEVRIDIFRQCQREVGKLGLALPWRDLLCAFHAKLRDQQRLLEGGAVGFRQRFGPARIIQILHQRRPGPRIVQPLSWPALLVSLVVCLKMYWVALLWRR